MTQTRIRDFGLKIGDLPTGKQNAITDITGLQVGHCTLISGEGKLEPGKGPVRTGVTAILPHTDNIYKEKVIAAGLSLNGHSKVLGLEQVREMGVIETPIVLTNTLNVGLAADALVEYVLEKNPDIYTINALVAETNDCYLNDIQGRHVKHEHVRKALETAASGPVEEGAVGAATGTSCFGWKGGIGTSSRVLPEKAGSYTVAALVQSNYGDAEFLTVCGVPVGQQIKPPPDVSMEKPQGSIIMVLATNAPLTSRQLTRLCRRAGIGLGRTGSIYGNTSGDVVIAFSTAQRVPWKAETYQQEMTFLRDDSWLMGQFFHAASDCIEESILNSLFQARTIIGQNGHTRHHLPVNDVVELVKRKLNS